MLPLDILNSNEPDVLRAALRMLEAQLVSALKQIAVLSEQVQKLTSYAVLQPTLDLVNAAPVAPIPAPSSPTPLDALLHGQTPEPPPPVPEPKPKPPQKGHGPKAQPGLTRVTRLYELDAPDCTCPQCGRERRAMAGEFETSEMVDVVDMKIELVVVQRAKYGCNCGQAIETAIGPARATEGGRYSLAFAIHVAIAKVLYHLPLDRQVRMYAEHGLDVSTQTLWDQIAAISRDLAATAQAIRRAILQEPVMGVDQTHWKDLAKNAPKAWQMWGLSSPTLLYYEICRDKGTDTFLRLLESYSGVLIADAASTHLAGVARRPSIRLAGCWAHVFRRTFFETQPRPSRRPRPCSTR